MIEFLHFGFLKHDGISVTFDSIIFYAILLFAIAILVGDFVGNSRITN